MNANTTISVLGCGWYGLAMAERLLEEGYTVKGSTTTHEKLSTLKSKGLEPYLFSIDDNSAYQSSFWQADKLIITVPPSGAADGFLQRAQSLAAKVEQMDYEQVIVISSTSVYPDTNGMVTEKDASYDSRSRSGVSLLTYEDLFQTSNTCVIRFGGLFGNARHPVYYLSGKRLPGGDQPVNLIHRSDCIGVTLALVNQHAIHIRYNACHPDHPTKEDYYTAAADALNLERPHFSGESSQFKIVSSEKLISDTSYVFSDKLPLH